MGSPSKDSSLKDGSLKNPLRVKRGKYYPKRVISAKSHPRVLTPGECSLLLGLLRARRISGGILVEPVFRRTALSLLRKGYIERIPPKSQEWSRYKITEYGVLRLIDPARLLVSVIMEA